MRPQLSQFEQIESYVLGSLSASEVTAFEKAMASSPELAGLVEFQTVAIQASKRKALRAEIAAVTNSGSSGFSNKWMWIFVALILAAGTIGAAIYMSGTEEKFRHTSEQTAQNAINAIDNGANASINGQIAVQDSVKAEEMSHVDASEAQTTDIPSMAMSMLTKNEVIPWVPFEKQQFTIRTDIGGTLEGNDGSLIVVPADAFLDKDGDNVEGQVQLELIEAIEWEDMLAYNLTTMSEGKALSSGGMLYVQPYQNGEKLQINPDRPLYIEIPTDECDTEMMAWEGDVNNGTIDWKSPTPLRRFLTKIDLALLDFIPTGFDAEVEASLPYKNHSKLTDFLVDSLYYALGKTFLHPTIEEDDKESVAVDKTSSFSNISPTPREMLMKGDRTKRKRHKGAKKKEVTNEEQVSDTENCCYIDPLSVKTILNTKFQNTFVATKEFEERLQAMHKHPNGQGILDIYLANLDKDMLVSDKLALKLVDGKDKMIFQAFVDQKATNIDGNIYQDQLSAFYNKKRKEYSDQLKRQQDDYRRKTTAELNKLQAELTALINKPGVNTVSTGSTASVDQVASMGISPPSPNVTQTNTYATTWYKAGWVNIDKYLHLLEKGAPQEVMVTIEDEKANAKIYQCIDILKTIIPLNSENGQAVAKFPNRSVRKSEQMEDSYCLAIAKNQDGLFYSERKYNPYATDHVYLKWEEIDEDELYSRLKKLSPHNSALVKSLKEEKERIDRQLAIYEKQEDLQKEHERVQAVQQLDQALRLRLTSFLNQCDVAATTTVPASAPVEYSFSFTPDGDGNNDFYFMSFGKSSIRNFSLQIFNERDMLVFETSDSNFRWDGENLVGLQCPQGVYNVRFSYQKNNAKREVNGDQRIFLSRNGTNF